MCKIMVWATLELLLSVLVCRQLQLLSADCAQGPTGLQVCWQLSRSWGVLPKASSDVGRGGGQGFCIELALQSCALGPVTDCSFAHRRQYSVSQMLQLVSPLLTCQQQWGTLRPDGCSAHPVPTTLHPSLPMALLTTTGWLMRSPNWKFKSP